jgi:hypothetical protein
MDRITRTVTSDEQYGILGFRLILPHLLARSVALIGSLDAPPHHVCLFLLNSSYSTDVDFLILARMGTSRKRG